MTYHAYTNWGNISGYLSHLKLNNLVQPHCKSMNSRREEFGRTKRLKDRPNEIKSERCGEEREMDAEREEDRKRVRDFCNGDDKQKDVGKWTMHRIQEKRGDKG